jgi:BR serine/threonine kinase
MLRPAPQVGEYVLQGTLGSGATGKVKLAEHRATGARVAIKIIRKTTVEDQPDLAVKIRREISLMRLLHHPHLLSLVDVLESAQHLYIILEYAEHGELFDYLTSHGSLSVEEGMRIFRQVVYGLEFLHSHGICHRDLKPENILLDHNDSVKIGDFGFARWMRFAHADTSCGSPHYAAPEIVRGETYDGCKSDIWSAGVVLYTLLSGTLPFDDTSMRALLEKVKQGKFRMPDFPAEIKDLVARMLEVDPAKRITIAQIKETDAFRGGLPAGYIPPTPLPIPDFRDPVDPDTLETHVLDTLVKLGYDSRSELFADLRSGMHTMAKVFVSILRNQVPLNSLPWRFDDAEVSDAAPGPWMFAGRDSFGTDERLAFAESSGSMSGGSMVESVFSQSDSGVAPETRTVAVNAGVEHVMRALQRFLTAQELAWFHPDESRMIARSKSEPPLDVAFQIVTDRIGNARLEIQFVDGNKLEFDSLADEVAGMVERVVDD